MHRNFEALTAYLAEREPMPFAWGSSANDCVSYAAGAAMAATAANPLGDLVWKDEVEADALIESLGGLAAATSERLRQIPASMAQRGDLAGVMRGNELGLMVVEGVTLVGPGIRRAIRRPRRDMVMAWSIG